MATIQQLQLGDIISAEYPINSGEQVVAEVTEIHRDVQQAVVYDGTETLHVDNSFKFTILNHSEEVKEQHYQSNTDDGIDLIDFWYMQMTPEEFQGAMKSNLQRYSTRLGRKDDRIKELIKIEEHATRYREKLEQEVK